MFFLALLESTVLVLLLTFGVTQIILPLIRKQPLFPLFRARRASLEGEIIELAEQIREEKLAEVAETLRKHLENLRNASETLDKTKQ